MHQFSHQNFLINHYAELASTNDLALELIKNNQAMSNQVILADFQTKGKGRIGRNWVSPKGNLYFSVILKLPNLENSAQLSFVAACALGEALNRQEINYKWPNDLLFNGKKIAGILLEKDADFVVIGIGVNLVSHPENTNYPATNLKECGLDFDAVKLLKDFLDQLAILKQKWQDFGFKPIRNLWIEKAFNLGKEIKVSSLAKSPTGIFVNLDDDGNLILQANGEEILISSGEIF